MRKKLTFIFSIGLMACLALWSRATLGAAAQEQGTGRR